jgi:galactose mutarotase-like enzyme
MTHVRSGSHRGWDLVVLESEVATVEVVPGKGGDVLSFQWLDGEVDVLWRSPWGLRQRGSAGTAADSATNLIEWYPGGWQTMLPNGGDEVAAYGTSWGMHGEVWLTPFDAQVVESGVELSARLVRSPLEVVRRIRLDGGSLSITETVTNVGTHPVTGVWGHHPAFGAPFLSGETRLDCGATEVVIDDLRDTDAGDLEIGSRSPWPQAAGRNGSPVDLREVPFDGAPCERMAYLTGFGRGWARLTSPPVGLVAELEWDAAVFPHAWLWTEVHATPGFPWFGAVDVLAVEPCTSFPAQGRENIAAKTDTLRTFEPGRSDTTVVRLTVAPITPG